MSVLQPPKSNLCITWGGGDAICCNAPARNLRMIKDVHVHADQHTKTRAITLPHPRVASVEPPRLVTTHFQKCSRYTKGVECNVIERTE